MSDAKEKERPRLEVFEGFAPDKESLRPGYAYLIRSSVRMPELYPLLGELLFASRVTGGEQTTRPNVIGMFIEDSPDNLMRHLADPDRYQSLAEQSITKSFGNGLQEPQLAVWVDTFGSFHNAGGPLKRIIEREIDGKKYEWWTKQVPGAGNPMAIMRFFRQVQAQELKADATINVFLLNSLSNLYRGLGLGETAAFLKTMLNESIWSSDISPVPNSILGKDGLFFAVLQENVLEPIEASYLESFFDGIINVMPCVLPEPRLRVAKVHVKMLPEIVQASERFVYMPAWQFESMKNKVSKLNGKDWRERKYIFIRDASGCDEQNTTVEKIKEAWKAIAGKEYEQ